MDVDWSKAPDWAVAHALYAFGGEISRMWVGETQYQPFDSLRPYPYGGGVGEVRHNCTRREFRYETLRSTPWTGEGLPPVGMVCEAGIPHVSGPNNETRSVIWIEGRVIAYHAIKDKTYAWFAEDDGFYPPGVFGFRPIRTPEQIAAEERQAAIKQMQKDCACYANADLFADLYDCGYRKQVKP